MAVFRAIENGFSLVRHTAFGLSQGVDYLGRVLNSMDHFKTKNRIMISHVPRKGTKTLYSMVGDYFAWIGGTFLLLIIMYTFLTQFNYLKKLDGEN
jgi:apolipoprotein N-acyltransferase